MAVIRDTEHEPGKLDQAVLGLIEDADLVIYDGNYTQEEMPRHRGDGHSTWQQGVKLCDAAGARALRCFTTIRHARTLRSTAWSNSRLARL